MGASKIPSGGSGLGGSARKGDGKALVNAISYRAEKMVDSRDNGTRAERDQWMTHYIKGN